MSFGKDQTGGFGDTLNDDSLNDASVDERALVVREQKVRAQFWDKLKRVAGKIPFVDDLVAAYYCSMDVQTPLKVRATLLGALAYFILPIDLVPDFIAGVGFGDDAAVLAAAISLVSAHIKPKHRADAARALDKPPPEDNGATKA
ncbi:MAG: YkvA family protein [Alphaproteobacteria bacterium]